MIAHDLETALSLTYAWIKAAHVIFVIFWIAGLFMLPRYYIYHQEATPGSVEEKRWIDRESKLRNIIITPAMLLVVALAGYHGYMGGYGKKLAAGQRPVSGKALRIMNEVPGLATVLIVILVIVKPF